MVAESASAPIVVDSQEEPRDGPDLQMSTTTQADIRPMVVFVAHIGNFGGTAVSLATLLRKLDRGLGRVLATPRDQPFGRAMQGEGLVDGVITLDPTTAPRALITGMARLVRWSIPNRRRLLAFHVNGLTDFVLATPAAFLTRRPVVVWAHHATLERRVTRYAGFAVRMLRRRIRWMAVSRALADALEEALRLQPGEVVVIPNPVDRTTAFASETSKSDATRIGFLGDDTIRKGFDLLPEVVRELEGRMRLLVFTRRHANRRPEVTRAWDDLEALDHTVEILGRQDDVRTAYAQCDVVICPSREESFARIVAEAMLNGIPVVASDIPAIREVMDDGRAGMLVPPGNAVAFARGLERLEGDPVLRSTLVEAGLDRVRVFEPSRIAEQFATAFAEGRSEV